MSSIELRARESHGAGLPPPDHGAGSRRPSAGPDLDAGEVDGAHVHPAVVGGLSRDVEGRTEAAEGAPARGEARGMSSIDSRTNLGK